MEEESLHDYTLDLLQDDSFVRYLKNTSLVGDKDWGTWLVSDPKNQNIVTEAQKILESIKENPIADTELKEKIWQRIDQSTASTIIEETGFEKSRIIKLFGLAIAASLLLLLINKFSFNSTVNYNTGLAQVDNITLPDNSVVKLNSESKLSYNESKFINNRTLELKGEAFFEVQKGSEFIVNTELGNVTVLGTSFNVKVRNNHFAVECITGSVKVKNRQNEVILKPNQSCESNRNGQLEMAENSERYSWINGKYSYHNRKLSEVIDDFQRQFDIKVILPESIQNIQYTGFFTTSDRDQALESICWPLHLNWKIEGSEIIISE